MGRYRLGRAIGEGGMGVVWAATHLVTGRPVAIKILKRNDPNDVERFLREARIGASLQHPNVVQVFDFWELPDSGASFMVMELLHGESLAGRLLREGKLSLHETAEILVSVASALKSAHERGLVHRDLKPENIFLAQQDDGSTIVKVLDFGLARATERTVHPTITQTGAIVGTPHYMAPEQFFGESHLAPSADVWALGVVFVECLSGQFLFDGDTFERIAHEIAGDARPRLETLLAGLPSSIVELVGSMLAHDRTHRPSISKVLATLGAYRSIDGAPTERMLPIAEPCELAPPSSRTESGTVRRRSSRTRRLAPLRTEVAVEKSSRREWGLGVTIFVATLVWIAAVCLVLAL
ncbi:serine/threonine-protein kinase [Pendulispora albinea]|uniref:non-specific serine/threonine protein kinase n=1 Tax=Pendulispora albinea TaxID=2741071 RepID=A0ABZ2LRN9_9BACT